MPVKLSPVMIEALKLFCTDGIEIVTYYSLGNTHSAVRKNGLWHSKQISVKTLSALRDRKLTTSEKIESTREWSQCLTDSGKALCRELGIIKDEPVVTEVDCDVCGGIVSGFIRAGDDENDLCSKCFPINENGSHTSNKLSKSQIAAVTAIADKKLEVSCNGDIYAAFSGNLAGLTAVHIDTIEALEDKGYIYRNINGLYPKLSLTDSGKALCRELGIIKDEPTQETKPVEQAQPAIKIGDCFVKEYTSQNVVFVLTTITPSRFDDIGNGIFETANEAKQVHGLTYFLNSMLDNPRDKWRRATAEETKQILDAKMRQISDERQRLFDLHNELQQAALLVK